MKTKTALQKCSIILPQIGFCLVALRPIPRLPPLLSLLYRGCWLIWLLGLIIFMYESHASSGSDSIAYFVGTWLFISNTLTTITILCETTLKCGTQQKLERLRAEVDVLIEEYLHISMAKSKTSTSRTYKTLLLIASILFWELAKVGFHVYGADVPVFWYTMSILPGIHMRFVEMILLLMDLNHRIDLLLQTLNKLAAYNKPKLKYTSDVWMPYAMWEYEQVNSARLIYGRIFDIFKLTNDCFGWSILIMFQSTFFIFVCNSFWCFEIVVVRRSMYAFAFNCVAVISLANLVLWLIVIVDSGYTKSLTVGHLICQLAKPLGNKSYNDLVTAFSLQTLHQQFSVTAKGFFYLNFSMLSRMISATATYLVILIQFLLAEKKN